MAALTEPQSRVGTGLTLGVASTALDGHTSGDLHLVLPGATRSLVCVMDGLGHGVDARQAAEECAAVLRLHASEPLLDLIQCCHEGLRSTRGVAMTLGTLDMDSGELSWVAIGNVDGMVLRPGRPLGSHHGAVIQRGGVVGYRLPPLKLSQVLLEPGDVIVMATDGIRSGFVSALDPAHDPQPLAEDILRRFSKGTDDALVLVARYDGGGA
jgi:serine phosphatase RsbU (regulator of sigma subunit)